jgi:formylglycine-generating enzyme required for sulfatase activity
MARIYISSTYEDLKKEREAAAQAVRRLGHQPVYMEDYVAGPQRPVEKCLQDVRSCDAYVGIFALRYGSSPPGYDKSITHLEYETAKKAGISPLMFLLDQKASWPVEYVDTGQERHKVDALRNELKTEYTVSFFKNADELSGLVSAAVSNLILIWVRSSIKSILTNKDQIKDINEKPYEFEGVSAETKNIVMKYLEEDRKNRFKEIEEVLNALQARLNNPWDALLDKKIKPVDPDLFNGKPMPDSGEELKEADFGDRIIMVYIPPGKFEMVSNDFDRKKLTHEVYLDGYRIGKYEVTIKQYMKFVNETKSHYPEWREEGSKYHIKTGGDDYYKKLVSNENSPILGISWKDAGAYCEWLSKKTGLNFNLPTEAQWEKAARGNDSRQYPWGDRRPDPILANFGDNIGKTTPVGSYPEGASPYGLLDMAGNVWEWCSDWYGPYNTYYQKNPTGPVSGTMRVVRGGSWYSDAGRLRCAVRDGVDPFGRSCYVGFRLCQDIK